MKIAAGKPVEVTEVDLDRPRDGEVMIEINRLKLEDINQGFDYAQGRGYPRRGRGHPGCPGAS